MISFRVYALHESGNGGISHIIVRIRTVGMYKRADRFDRFFFFPFPTSFASLPPLFSPLSCPARVYSITSLQHCVEMSLSFFSPSLFSLYFYFRPTSAFTLFAFFSLFLRHVSFFLFFVFFATNRTTRYPYFRLFDY